MVYATIVVKQMYEYDGDTQNSKEGSQTTVCVYDALCLCFLWQSIQGGLLAQHQASTLLNLDCVLSAFYTRRETDLLSLYLG